MWKGQWCQNFYLKFSLSTKHFGQNVQFQYFSEEKERFPRQPSDFQVEYKNKILCTRKQKCKIVKVLIPLFLQSPVFDLQDAEFSDSYSDSAPSQEVSFREDDNENDECTEKCQSKRGCGGGGSFGVNFIFWTLPLQRFYPYRLDSYLMDVNVSKFSFCKLTRFPLFFPSPELNQIRENLDRPQVIENQDRPQVIGN